MQALLPLLFEQVDCLFQSASIHTYLFGIASNATVHS
jgi:hypothetical protein